MLFVLAVVVAAVVSFLRVSIYFKVCLLARVGVLGHRRGTALGHLCGMTLTGANIAVLLLKTLLALDSTNTYQPTVVGLSVGMMAMRAVLYCGAVLCCAVLLLPFVLLVYASTEVTKTFFIARKCP